MYVEMDYISPRLIYLIDPDLFCDIAEPGMKMQNFSIIQI